MAVQLARFGESDFDQLITWISSEDLMTNWSGSLFKFPLTKDSLSWYIQDSNESASPEVYIYKVLDAESGKCIGHISLGGISKKNNCARITRVLIGDADAKGKGYCADMIREILRIGFEELNLHRISLGVYDTNDPAIKCYERAGMVREGIQRDVLYHEGKYWSILEMSMLKHEWKMNKD